MTRGRSNTPTDISKSTTQKESLPYPNSQRKSLRYSNSDTQRESLCDPTTPTNPVFPTTRYQGSKRKLASTIVDAVADLNYTTVLDAFGGTGSVSYAFKAAGNAVTYNDILSFNHQIGLALIENDTVLLDAEIMDSVGIPVAGRSYQETIQREFEDIYFTDDENRWLDVAVGNIRAIKNQYQRAIAWYALFQSALAKRPYNLFHRRNLYMRMANVPRSFGNKVSWDRPFPQHFRFFAGSAHKALIDSGGRCRAICSDAGETTADFDLVYIDTPYLKQSGVGVAYRDFYHFLEGLMGYDSWPDQIDRRSKHRGLLKERDPWCHPKTCHEMFRQLFDHHRKSILVVSYRSDGIPTIDELIDMLRAVKNHVRLIEGPSYQYALSTNRTSKEVLLIGS